MYFSVRKFSASNSLLWCYLPVCLKGAPRPLECDFCQGNYSCCAELPGPPNQLKAHTTKQQWSFYLNGRLCRERLLAKKLGQLLSFKDCSWQADPSCGFILKLLFCDMHKQSFPHIQNTPLFSTHPCSMWISDSYFIAYTYIESVRERERGSRERRGLWQSLGRETKKETEKNLTLDFSNVRPWLLFNPLNLEISYHTYTLYKGA